MLLCWYCLIVICGELLADGELNLRKNEEEDDEIDPLFNNLVRNKTKEEIQREHTQEFWNNIAIETLKQKLYRPLNENTAKNVIFFMGDGLSIPTIAATRVYLGGEEKQLSFEKFPYAGFSKTYCVDYQTADSACSATAYLGGVKANFGTIGVSAAVKKRNCTAMRNTENHVHSIARLFQQYGKGTGLVTNMRVTHASPAGVYAHTAYRGWESDRDVIKNDLDPNVCEDIAHQLVFGETGRRLNVILGGGRKKMLPRKSSTSESGERYDRINLIREWINLKQTEGARFEYLWDRQQLLNVENDTEYLMGLFNRGHMKYNLERDTESSPSLAEMTEAALKVLQNNPNGYFLFVEGGKIDHAHHSTTAHKALDETAEFSKAIELAVNMTSEADTLIVVTADHGHTMSYSGYAVRGSNVFGYAGTASDDKLYTILSYANGPGYKVARRGARYVPFKDEMNKTNFRWPSTSPLPSETHGGDDVGIFANGPWAHLFSGVMEENVIPHLIAFAACVGSEIDCNDYRKKSR